MPEANSRSSPKIEVKRQKDQRLPITFLRNPQNLGRILIEEGQEPKQPPSWGTCGPGT